MTIIRTVEELNALYGATSEASLVKVTDRLTPEYAQMIEASPFAALATVGPEGLDCSPRGDDVSVVRIADGKTVLMPDWRGNNRVDSLANIVRDPRVALMFLVPGSNTAMRINGRRSSASILKLPAPSRSMASIRAVLSSSPSAKSISNAPGR